MCSSTNSEGCFIIQIALFYFKQHECYNDFFEDMLNKTFEWMTLQPMNDVLKGILINNVMAAFYYNAGATFTYLEQKGLLENFLTDVTTVDWWIKHKGQRKLYLLGLGHMLECDNTPQWVMENYHIIVSKMIIMLGRIQLNEKFKHEWS